MNIGAQISLEIFVLLFYIKVKAVPSFARV